MYPSNPAKVGVAFLAGIAVALASAMVYVKTSATHPSDSHPVLVIQAPPQPESLNAAKTDEAAAPTPPPAKPAAVAAAPTQAPDTAAPSSAPIEVPVPLHPAAQQATASRPHVAQPATAATHTAYPNYRRRNWNESPSTIRVEVSQLRPSSIPPGATLPPNSAPAVRLVNEEKPVLQPVNTGVNYSVPAPAAPQPHTETLPAGTNVTVRLGETVSTDHNYSGDTFRATLDSPIIMDGFVIAEKGSKVLGKVVGADKAGKFQGTANLQLTVTEINTTDGQRVRIETNFLNRKGPANSGEDAAKIGGGAVLGAIIGAIAGGGKGAAIGAGAGGAAGTGAVLLGKGRPATVQNETRLTFQLVNATTITERLN